MPNRPLAIAVTRIGVVACAAAAAAIIGACASPGAGGGEDLAAAAGAASPIATGYWTPGAAPTFVAIDREQTMLVRADETRDMLVLVTDGTTASGRPAGRYTWIVSLPREADLGRPLRVGDDNVEAWVHERKPGGRRLLPALGAVTLQSRTADRVTASLALSLHADPTPGAAQGPTLFMDAACDRIAPAPAVPTPPLPTASGTKNRPQKPEPDRRPVDPVWPWGEIVGDHPRPMPKN